MRDAHSQEISLNYSLKLALALFGPMPSPPTIAQVNEDRAQAKIGQGVNYHGYAANLIIQLPRLGSTLCRTPLILRNGSHVGGNVLHCASQRTPATNTHASERSELQIGKAFTCAPEAPPNVMACRKQRITYGRTRREIKGSPSVSSMMNL